MARTQSAAVRLAITAACIVAATALRYALQPVVGTQAPFITFLVASVVVAGLCGTLNGIATAFIGGALAQYFFSGESGRLLPGNTAGWVHCLLYYGSALGGVWLVGSLRSAVHDAETAIRLAEKRGEEMAAAEERSKELGKEVQSSQRALRESEARFRTLADAAPVMIRLTGPDARCTWLNKTYLAFTGQTDVQGGLGDAWEVGIHEEEREGATKAFLEAFRKREPWDIEYRLRRADGEYRWVEDRGVPHLESDGSFLGYIAICLDVMERKRSKEALQSQFDELRGAQDVLQKRNEELAESRRALEMERSRYRELFDSAPVGYVISDRQGVIQQANVAAARLLNEGAQFLPGFPLSRLLAKEDRTMFFSHIGRLTREEVEKIENWEVTLQPHLRVPFPCSITVNLVRDTEGRPSGLRWLMRDVSERKQAEERILKLNTELEQRVRERTTELEKANSELEAFSYSVSHDLRAPLRSISGFSKAVLEDYGNKLDEQGVLYLTYAHEGSMRMSQLIDDLLAFSKYSRVEMHRISVDLSGLAEEIISELRKSEPARKVDVNIAPNLRAEGDEALLRIVLQNLLNNAWKFTAKRELATIEFGSTEANNSSVFYVKDNGAGFNMAQSKRLFGVFQRLHSDQEFPGTGVGLATVSRVIRRHGGEIWAQAQPENGATFCFTLPRVKTVQGLERPVLESAVL